MGGNELSCAKMKAFRVTVVLACCVMLATSSPLMDEDTWETDQDLEAPPEPSETELIAWDEENTDLLQAGWGKIAKKQKKVSMDTEVTLKGGVAAGSLCFETSLPSWVPTQLLQGGMKAILEGPIKKVLAAKGMSMTPDSATEILAENICDRKENPRQLVTYSKDIPFIGKLSFTIYGSEVKVDFSKVTNRLIAAISQLKRQEGATDIDDLVQSGWGGFKPSKKTISMDTDIKHTSGAASGSMCFETQVPSWIPNSLLGTGMKTLLEGTVAKHIQKAGATIAPDKASEVVAAGNCDRKENPTPLLQYSKELPFIGKLSLQIFGGNLNVDLSKLGLRL